MTFDRSLWALQAWRLDGNMLFEKPFSAGRDAMDLILSLGIARRFNPALHLGVELMGEDLEGFWDAEEAEGGPRLLIGPSLRLAPPGRRWHFGAAGGPMIHRGNGLRESGASRALPASPASHGFAAKASLSYAF